MHVILGAHSQLAILLSSTSRAREDWVSKALPEEGISLGKIKADLCSRFPTSKNRCFCFCEELNCERSSQC